MNGVTEIEISDQKKKKSIKRLAGVDGILHFLHWRWCLGTINAIMPATAAVENWKVRGEQGGFEEGSSVLQPRH